MRARCNSWTCLYCGPRKVDQWRQLVKAAEPTLFLTLTKAGHTVDECARALTTFLQYLRRGSKGRGPYRVGVREAYPVEYFGVLERHRDFERVGFHWHLLIKSVEYVPHEVLKEGWFSATHGASYIVHVEAVRKPQVIGYVTKYLMKSLSQDEKGFRKVERERVVYRRNKEGKGVKRWETRLEDVASSARRIRYSRQFFPESVADLRARLFAGLEETAMEKQTNTSDGLPLAGNEEVERPVQRSSWTLFEQEPLTDDLDEHARWRQEALREALSAMREGHRELSRRVISMWAYQRSELRKS